MATKSVQAAVDSLIEAGVISEEQLVHAASVVEVLATLQGIQVSEPGAKPARKTTARARTGSRRKAGKKAGKRARRGKLSALNDKEFAKLYYSMTARELAEQVGVAEGTVAVRASKLGLRKIKRADGGARGKGKAKKTRSKKGKVAKRKAKGARATKRKRA